MKNRVKKEKTESSMSNASKLICQKEECTGRVAFANHEDALVDDKKEVEDKKATTRSSMKFGGNGVCLDDECIGKT